MPKMLCIISCASRTTKNLKINKINPKQWQMLFLLSFFGVSVNLFYLHGDNNSGILNVFERNKHLNTIQNHRVVQIRLRQGSFCRDKVFANPFSSKCKAPTYFTHYCDLLDPSLKISLILLFNIFQMSPLEQV